MAMPLSPSGNDVNKLITRMTHTENKDMHTSLHTLLNGIFKSLNLTIARLYLEQNLGVTQGLAVFLQIREKHLFQVPVKEVM
jgi:hypothetical protein